MTNSICFLLAMYMVMSVLDAFHFSCLLDWKMINNAPSGMNFYLRVFGITQES